MLRQESNTAASIATGFDSLDKHEDDRFKMRTFDLFWINKNSLMHRDGIAKV
jgi:hypothetical protein